MRTTHTRTEFVTSGTAPLRTAKPVHIVMEVQGDTLTFREKGTRKRFKMTIAAAAKEALIRDA